MELSTAVPRFAIGVPPTPARNARVHPIHTQFLLRCNENPNEWVSIEVPSRSRASACVSYLKSRGIKTTTRALGQHVRVYGIKEES